MMPVMTGEEAVRELRKRGSKVFVVGATGNALKGKHLTISPCHLWRD
jgi:CheY-like chemotaxis protein